MTRHFSLNMHAYALRLYALDIMENMIMKFLTLTTRDYIAH